MNVIPWRIRKAVHVIKYQRTTFEDFRECHFDVLSIEIIKDVGYRMSILMGQVRNRAKGDGAQ